MEGKEIQVEYIFSKIDVVQFSIIEKNVIRQNSEAQFNTEAQFMYDNEHHVLCSRIATNATQQDKPIMDIELRCYFDINPKSIELLKQGDNIVFPAPLLIQFASLCYGSMRGVIHTKTEGTLINHFILPPLYFHSVIKNDFVISK